MDRQVTSPERTRLHVIRPLINAPYVLFIVIMQARMKSYLLLNGITIKLRLYFQEFSR